MVLVHSQLSSTRSCLPVCDTLHVQKLKLDVISNNSLFLWKGKISSMAWMRSSMSSEEHQPSIHCTILVYVTTLGLIRSILWSSSCWKPSYLPPKCDELTPWWVNVQHVGEWMNFLLTEYTPSVVKVLWPTKQTLCYITWKHDKLW